MEGETSKQKYKLVEYREVIYEIPIRKLNNSNHQQIILWSDVLSIAPKATCCLYNAKLIPFQLDENLNQLKPKRIVLDNEEEETVWEVHVPENNQGLLLEQIASKLDYLIQHQLDQDESTEQQIAEDETSDIDSNNDSIPSVDDNTTTTTTTNNNNNNNENAAVSSSSSTNNNESNTPTPSRHEAPPSYETSMLSTIHALTSKLRLFELHIPNRHKSPKWLPKRDAWINQKANSIEEVAYLLVQLEMALLWTAVEERWIEERETWLTLVANSRSERHLAGAILNLERHTLVMDEQWLAIRERWINELLEMVVLPLSHG